MHSKICKRETSAEEVNVKLKGLKNNLISPSTVRQKADLICEIPLTEIQIRDRLRYITRVILVLKRTKQTKLLYQVKIILVLEETKLLRQLRIVT